MSLTAGKIAHLKNLSTPQGVIAAAAMDQRGSLKKSIAVAKGVAESAVTDEMMAEFKVAVTKILTPHASAILLDPEYGIPATKARAKNAGLLLAYEYSGYDNTQPGRLPDLLPHLSVKRIKDLGADAVKILIYYTPFEKADTNDIKHAFIERVGAECLAVCRAVTEDGDAACLCVDPIEAAPHRAGPHCAGAIGAATWQSWRARRKARAASQRRTD